MITRQPNTPILSERQILSHNSIAYSFKRGPLQRSAFRSRGRFGFLTVVCEATTSSRHARHIMSVTSYMWSRPQRENAALPRVAMSLLYSQSFLLIPRCDISCCNGRVLFHSCHRRHVPCQATNNDEPDSEQTPPSTNSVSNDIKSVALPRDSCLIESRQSFLDFADLRQEDLKEQIESRRNRVFLLLEEIRRLRIQSALRSRATHDLADDDGQEYESVVPMLNQTHYLQDKNIRKYIAFYFWMVTGIILFGGLIAPSLEVRMGLGGTSYLQFIQSMHLPEQLAEVDPIVASFCGGAVGALSTLLVIDLNNVRNQQRNRSAFGRPLSPDPCIAFWL